MNLDIAEKTRPLDWNSVKLLSLLSLPASIMAILLLKWPDVTWRQETLHTAIVLVGSLATIILSVFTVVRFRDNRGIEYLSSGLMVVGIIGGFQAVSSPDNSIYIWFHLYSGFVCGSCFLAYLVMQRRGSVTNKVDVMPKRGFIFWLIVASLMFGIMSIFLSGRLPEMISGGKPTQFSWILNSIPLILYFASAIYLFYRYRSTGKPELFLFTAVLIFLFQTTEVFYFVRLWSLVWWFWLFMRLGVYVFVMAFVLKEYIQANNKLRLEMVQRRRIENNLRESEANWKNSFDSLDDALSVVDADYNVICMNSAAEALVKNRDYGHVQDTCHNMFRANNQPCQSCVFTAARNSKRPESMHYFIENTGRHFTAKAVPVLNDDGNIERFVYCITDITEKVLSEEKEKLMQRELSQRSRLASIGEVVAGVTHEINNPLTSIIAFAQLMKKSDIPENFKEAVDVINESTTRVAEIVDKLHTFSRRQRPDKEMADINQIISGVLQMRSYEIRKNDIEVVSDLGENIPKTMINVGQIQQVMLNIIVNAEQAVAQTKKHGIIMVNSRTCGDWIKISVSDNGFGIKEEYMEKLFTPFFTTKDMHGGPGLGLGLSISYGIIKEHGGKIYARSTAGSGATFTVEIPVTAERVPAAILSVAAEPVKKSPATSKVFVLDDEVHIRRAIERVLSGEGMEVASTANAQHALITVLENDFDLIVLDIKMPGMDGIGFFEHLVKVKPAYRNKVICMTGDLVSSRNKDFIKKENIPYLIKPFGIDELLERVNAVIGGKTSCVSNESLL